MREKERKKEKGEEGESCTIHGGRHRLKWISFDRAGPFPPTRGPFLPHLRRGDVASRGDRVGQAFSLYLTSGTTLYFVRNESVMLCLSLRRHSCRSAR